MVAGTQALEARTWPRDVPTVRRTPDPARRRAGRAGELLLDAGMVIGLAYLLPFVILLAGAPIALTLTALLWLAGAR
jgi:hypothetical protein